MAHTRRMPPRLRSLLLTGLLIASGSQANLMADDKVLVSTRREVLYILQPGEEKELNLNQIFGVYPSTPKAKITYIKGTDPTPLAELTFALRAKERAIETDTFLSYALAPNASVNDSLQVGSSYDLSWVTDYYWNPTVVNGFRTYGYLDAGTLQITGLKPSGVLNYNPIPSETSPYNGRAGTFDAAKAGTLGMLPLLITSGAYRPDKAFRLHLEEDPFSVQSLIFADLEGDATTLLKPLQGFTTYNLNPFFHMVEENFGRVPLAGTDPFNLANLYRIQKVVISPQIEAINDNGNNKVTFAVNSTINSAVSNKDAFVVTTDPKDAPEKLTIKRVSNSDQTGMIFCEITATYGDQKRYAFVAAYATNVKLWEHLEGLGTVSANKRYRVDGTVTWLFTDVSVDPATGFGKIKEDTLGELTWAGTASNLWVLDHRRQDWMWTSLYDPTGGYRTTFPFMYSLKEKGWVYFYYAGEVGSDTGTRWFYSYSQGKWTTDQ